MARQPGDEIDEALPNERLAARQPEAPRTQPDEGRAKAIEFVQRQQILARQESLPFGHAIGAAQVTPVRHRHAHVADLAPKWVNQRHVSWPVRIARNLTLSNENSRNGLFISIDVEIGRASCRESGGQYV